MSINDEEIKDIFLALKTGEGTSKKNLAYMISNVLNRVSEGGSIRGMNLLLAALVLLQTSDGKDQLLSVARKLAIRGMSLMRDKNVIQR